MNKASVASWPRRRALVALLVALLATVGCVSEPEHLMPTPVLYHDEELDPFGHLPPEEQSTVVSTFYATLREPLGRSHIPSYSNHLSDRIRLGRVRVRLGSDDMTWEDLYEASRRPSRERPIPLRLDSGTEVAEVEIGAQASPALTEAQRRFFEEVDATVASARDPDILVYVHGTRVDHERACVRAGELLHFAGRDFTVVVFDWPSHQNIVSYAIGTDRDHAYASAPHLATLLRLLADHTRAARIHLMCYSAGAIVTANALASFEEAEPSVPPPELKARLRLGTAFFAAGDVPLEEFLRELPAIHDVTDRVIVTVSDGDSVLSMATQWMGGGLRIGSEAILTDEHERFVVERLPRLEILDVSHGKEARGFDVTGHHYWYDHPWVSSDVILSLRVPHPPEERGLRPAGKPRVWFLPADYPERARTVFREALPE